MILKRTSRALFSGGAALAILVGVTTAQAELVSYDFTASVDSGSGAFQTLAGQSISGSFSFDSASGWWGGSNGWADPSLELAFNQGPASTTTSEWLGVEYNQGTLIVAETGYTQNWSQTAVTVSLTGQDYGNLGATGALPSSLSLGGSATGSLTATIFGATQGFLSATLTSLSKAGSGSATPELDPASGGAAAVLLLGGAGLIASERRKRTAVQFS